MVVLNDYGYAPHLLPGLGFADQWGKQPLYCKLKGGSFCNSGLGDDMMCYKAPSDRCRIISPFATGMHNNTAEFKCSETNPTGWWTQPGDNEHGLYNCNPDVDTCKKEGNSDSVCEERRRRCKGYNADLPVQTAGGFPLWKAGDGGSVVDCHFLLQNYNQGDNGRPQGSYLYTMENTGDSADRQNGYSGGENVHTAASHAGAIAAGYTPYYPHRSRMSPFYNQGWFWQSTDNDDVVGLGGSVKNVILYTYQPLFTRFPVLSPKLFSELVEEPKEVSGGKVRAMSETLSAFENQPVRTAIAKQALSGANTYIWENDPSTYNITTEKYNQVFATNYFNANDDGTLGTSTDLDKGFETMFRYPFIGVTVKKSYNASGDIKLEDKRANETFYGKDYNSNDIKEGEDKTANEKMHTVTNVFSRMSQKEALHHSQGAFWMCIVVVQWADLLICKTRWLSIRDQGMSNDTMNFGLFFETLLAAWLAYYEIFGMAFGTRNIRLTHWFPAMPFSMLIFGYDETRKYLMRTTSPVVIDKLTGRSNRKPGWLERNTYY